MINVMYSPWKRTFTLAPLAPLTCFHPYLSFVWCRCKCLAQVTLPHVVAILDFSRSAYACKKKYMTFLKNYKAEKITNGVFGNNRHGGKFYEAMDHWNHHNGQFIKVVSTSTISS